MLKEVGFAKVKKGQALKVDLESTVFIVAKGTLIHFIDEAASCSYPPGSLVVSLHLYPVLCVEKAHKYLAQSSDVSIRVLMSALGRAFHS